MTTIRTTARGTRVTITGGHFTQQSFYATPKGIRLNHKSQVLPAEVVLGLLSKGEARQLRKGLRKAGRGDLARSRRDEEAALRSLDAAALAMLGEVA